MSQPFASTTHDSHPIKDEENHQNENLQENLAGKVGNSEGNFNELKSSNNDGIESNNNKEKSSCCCCGKKSKEIETVSDTKSIPVNHSNQQQPIVDENRPKPIPAPPMNDQCREYCKKVLHQLLDEYGLLVSKNEVEVKSCCQNMQNNHCSKWPQLITICGIGSLLSEKSARRTFPNLINFRKAIVKNYVRCFNLVAISSLNFGDLEKRKIASVAAVHQSDLTEETIHKINQLQGKSNENKEIEMFCSVFEIPLTEEIWCAYMTREHRYEFKFVTIDQDFQNGSMKPSCSCCGNNCNCSEFSSCGCKALMCCQFNDESYRIERCSSYENEYHERVAQHFQGRLWYHTKHVQSEKHDDIPIKPIPKYLELCFNAALEMGRPVFQNFLQTSVMADGETLLEDYLKVEEPELYEKFIVNQQD